MFFLKYFPNFCPFILYLDYLYHLCAHYNREFFSITSSKARLDHYNLCSINAFSIWFSRYTVSIRCVNIYYFSLTYLNNG